MPSDPRRPARRRHAEDGNTLLLMPVGVLILLVLGGIAVDFAVVYAAQREVANVSAGAANDAAGAVDEAAFFETGQYRIDRGRAAGVVQQVIGARTDDGISITCPTVALDAPDLIRVGCVGTVDLIFAPALPNTSSSFTVRATSTARAAEG